MELIDDLNSENAAFRALASVQSKIIPLIIKCFLNYKGVLLVISRQNLLTFRFKSITMTIAAIRTQVHKYVDEADIKVLEVVHQLLEVYRQNNSSVLSEEQQKDVLKRSALYKSDKTKGYSISEARKIIKQKLSS